MSNAVEQARAFDALPKALRAKINAAPFKFSALAIQAYFLEFGEAKAADLIDSMTRQLMEMAEEERKNQRV